MLQPTFTGKMADVLGVSWGKAALAALEQDDYGFGGEPAALAVAGGPGSLISGETGNEGEPRALGVVGESRALGVVVGSDDPFTRHAFRSGASGPGIEVLAEGTVTAVSRQLAAELEPDIVLLDVQIAAAQALCAIQHIRARVPGTRILACSEPAGIEFGLLCLHAGAWGYVSKEIDLAMLPRLLQALGHGEAVIPRALATELVRRFARPITSDSPNAGELSAPECRLLELLRTDLTLPEAAAQLGIALATARRHLGSARRKLSVAPPASALGTGWSSHPIHPMERGPGRSPW